MSRVLVTGLSGTGKSSALEELGRRGYRVVDTGDPGWRESREYVEPADELQRREWRWVEEMITGVPHSDDGRSRVVRGRGSTHELSQPRRSRRATHVGPAS